MHILDTIHTLIAIVTSLVMFMVVWWKVSSESKLNRASIQAHDKAIASIEECKTDNVVTQKLLTAIEKIERDLVEHHTDFRMHRTEDSERRMADLILSMNELARENRADHQIIMNKLGRVERLNGKQ
jgi:hypothetical protein